MHCISGAMSFPPEGKIASSRKKIAVRTVVLRVPDLCLLKVRWYQKMWALVSLRLHLQIWSVCECRNDKKISFMWSTHIFVLGNFLQDGGNTMAKTRILTCLLPSRLQQLLILFWIAANSIWQQHPHRNTSLLRLIFHPPTTPWGLALQPELLESKTFPFSDPT